VDAWYLRDTFSHSPFLRFFGEVFGYKESVRLIGSQRRIVSAHKLLHKKLKAGKKREKESQGVVR